MINVRMQQKDVKRLSPKITVIGVGGAGGNAVNNMISSGLQGCDFLVCNSDAQALEGSLSETRLQLGVTVTGGLGAGAKPEIGRAAAEESLDDVMQHLEGANMVFITAGMGGGTGTGAAPVIARQCREMGILTVGVVTKPFHFEGSHRMKMAEEGIEEMQGYVDTLIVIPNQNLFRVANEKTTFAEAFKMADSVLQSGVRGVTDLMVMPGLINLDFADIRSAMMEMGKAMMGTGEASSDRRAIEAAEAAINNPLLDDVSMKGARGVIINVTGGMDMTLFEVDEACNRIRDEVDPNANIIFGSTFDEKLDGVMRVSVVATGIDVAEAKVGKPVPKSSLLNTITGNQPERKLERAQPNTEAIKETVAVTQPSAPVMTAPIVPGAVRAPITTDATAKKLDEPEGELFEQQEFVAAAPVPVQTVETPATATPKATYYNDSFIPPKPVDAGQVSTPVVAPSVQAPVQSTTVQQPVQAEVSSPAASLSTPQKTEVEPPVQTTTGSSLNLRPPVPGSNTQRKKSPSLFERFTSPLWHSQSHDDEDKGETGTQETGGESGGGPGLTTGLRAPSRPGQQGSLNIDSPGSESAEDELDIPAFLRRQAN